MSEQIYIAHEDISPDKLKGTFEQWKKYLADTDWYEEYLEESNESDMYDSFFMPVTKKHWIMFMLATHLIAIPDEELEGYSNYEDLKY